MFYSGFFICSLSRPGSISKNAEKRERIFDLFTFSIMSLTNIDDPVIQPNSIVGTEKKYNFHEIIYGHLRPWLTGAYFREPHYIDLLRNFVRTPKNSSPHYRISRSEAPFTAKIKYYLCLIDNDTTEIINQLMKEEKNSKNLIAYKIDKSRKELIDLLVEIQALIEQRKFADEDIFSKEVYSDADCNQKECAYIFHYLFDACVCCLLEIQADFAKFIPQNDLLTVGDIYNMIVKKPFSEEQFIREIDVTETDAGLISPSFQLKKDESFVRQYAHEKYLTFMDEVEFYRFDQLPKISTLSSVHQNRLIRKIIENPLPYSIAMLSYLGYLDSLHKSYAMSKVNIYLHIAKAFHTDVRTVKGNCLVLNPYSKEDRCKYQADRYLGKVEKDYQAILESS